MNTQALDELIQSVLMTLDQLVIDFKNSPEDWGIANGNVAVCIITDEGKIYGKFFGENKIKQREVFQVAFTKASQVWITGFKTGDYEKMVFGGDIHPEKISKIRLPELIGWQGGQPIKIDSETTISVGFSGFRGQNDLDIVVKAFSLAQNL